MRVIIQYQYDINHRSPIMINIQASKDTNTNTIELIHIHIYILYSQDLNNNLYTINKQKY